MAPQGQGVEPLTFSRRWSVWRKTKVYVLLLKRHTQGSSSQFSNRSEECILTLDKLLSNDKHVIESLHIILFLVPTFIRSSLQKLDKNWIIMSSIFYERICANILAPIKIQTSNVSTKKPRLKCWWNWHLAALADFSPEVIRGSMWECNNSLWLETC